MSAPASKPALRKEALARRDALDPCERIEMSLAAADHVDGELDFLPATVISGFLPIRSEIDPRPALDRLRARGARLCLPAILDHETIVFRELVRGAALVDMGFGTFGPGPEAAVLNPQIMLVPLAAFDASGHRIGYGGGYYDRAIRQLRRAGLPPRLIGFAFSAQEVDHVPAETHDEPLDAIVTERGYRRFEPATGRLTKAN